MRAVLVHFDVTNDHILLDTFISSAKAAQAAVDALSSVYFGGDLEFELIVIPPKSGSFKQYIGIAVKTVGYSYIALWSVIQLMDSDTVQRVSQELTGRIPADHLIDVIDGDLKDEVNGPAGGDHIEVLKKEIERIEEMISDSVQGALEKTRDEISKLEIPDGLKYELENAQAELYGAALNDSDVRGIGFGEEDDFPIQRNQFAQRAVRPIPRKIEDELDPDWQVGLIQIKVTSPNFERPDQATRKWKGKTSEGTTILFEIEDEEFWQKLHSRDIEFTESTIIEAQMATLFVDGRPKIHRAIRVLKVGEIHVANPLDDNAIASIVGKFRNRIAKEPGPDLLSFL